MWSDISPKEFNRIRLHEVSDEDIADAERVFNIKFPEDLVFFWKNIGYGMIGSSLDGSVKAEESNRFMGPYSVGMAINKEDEYAEILNPECSVPFFELGNDFFISIDKRDGKIKKFFIDDESYSAQLISNNLKEFFDRISENPNFFILFETETGVVK